MLPCWETWNPAPPHDPRARDALRKIATVGMLPVQLIDRRRLRPEERLLLAMLEDAILDLQQTRRDPAAVRRRAEAQEWICGCAARVSFEFVCETLGFDVGRMRAGLLALVPETRDRSNGWSKREDEMAAQLMADGAGPSEIGRLCGRRSGKAALQHIRRARA